MAACDPAPAPAGGICLYNQSLPDLPRLQELLCELDGAIAAGGSPWHLAELRASRDLLRQLVGGARRAARAPVCLAELEHERARALARGGWLGSECRAEEQPDGSYQVLTVRGRVAWWGDAHCAACALKKVLEASCVDEALGSVS